MTNTSGRRIVIGDVHGHYRGLMDLMDLVAPTSNDQVYFLGDLIDRGPQSAQVVEFVKENNYSCLLGNHEQMLLKVMTSKRISSSGMHGWLYNGGQATIASYKQGRIPQEHLDWLQSLPLYLDLGDVWLTHAGVDPYIPLPEQTADQFCWIREEFHGIPQPYFDDKLIIIGHTITFTFPGIEPGKLAQGQGWLNIDTGAYHPRSGWLTALDVTNKLIHQVNIFQECHRTLPLSEGVVMVEPSKISARRQKHSA